MARKYKKFSYIIIQLYNNIIIQHYDIKYSVYMIIIFRLNNSYSYTFLILI